jgi:small subunit ribosomal protein S2
MRRLPDAVIVVDAQYEDTAIREAKRLFIPVIAIVDSRYPCYNTNTI